MKLGKLAAWTMLDQLSATEAAAFAQKVEQLGYSALWQPEGFGRNILVQSGWLLANTNQLIGATASSTSTPAIRWRWPGLGTGSQS